MQHQNPRGKRHHCAHDVFDQQNGEPALLVDAGQDVDHAVGLGRPQSGHHLVEQQQLRIGGERAGNLEAFAVGQRQRRGRLCALVVEVEPCQHLAGMRARRGDVQPAVQRTDHHVVLDAEAGEWPHQLEGPANAAVTDFVGSQSVDPLASERNSAFIRRKHAGDHVEQRGLAGAVGADHREDRAWRHRERHVGYGTQPAELLRDVGDLKQRGHVRAPPCRGSCRGRACAPAAARCRRAAGSPPAASRSRRTPAARPAA